MSITSSEELCDFDGEVAYHRVGDRLLKYSILLSSVTSY